MQIPFVQLFKSFLCLEIMFYVIAGKHVCHTKYLWIGATSRKMGEQYISLLSLYNWCGANIWHNKNDLSTLRSCTFPNALLIKLSITILHQLGFKKIIPPIIACDLEHLPVSHILRFVLSSSVQFFILKIHLHTKIILTKFTNITNNKLQEMINYNTVTKDIRNLYGEEFS